MMVVPNLNLYGKVALITGCRRGIGRAIALSFAEAGADVIVSDWIIEDGLLESVVKEIRRLNRSCLAVQVDISQKSAVDDLVLQAMENFGVIDILVNNAAIDIRTPLLELSEDDWDRTMDINLKGYFLCSQAVAKGMVKRRKGNIISMASQLAFKAWATAGSYCISKAGVTMLTRVLARELGVYGIRVNAIAPSSVRTELGRPTWSDPKIIKRIESAIPLDGRIAEPSDIVGTALFLASDASNYISGHTILIDAGTNA